MQTSEIPSCSCPTNGSTSSFDVLETSSRRQNVALSSLRSDDTPNTRIIAIAVKAHEKLRLEPFAYAFNHLVEQRNCKVVIICCLSRLQNEMGMDHVIDVEMFGGINKKKLEAAINTQINNLDHFLRVFRERLDQRGVPMDIRIPAGPKSVDILVNAARAIHPHWVVLDLCFSGSQKQIQAALACNLVLMRKQPQQMPLILKSTPIYLGPVDQIHDRVHEEDPGFVMGGGPSPGLGLRTPSLGYNGANGTTAAMISSDESMSIQNNSQATSSSSSSKVYTCITCMCFSGKAGNKRVDGPTDKQTVLYGTKAPGSKAIYLGNVGHPSMNPDDSISSTRISSP